MSLLYVIPQSRPIGIDGTNLPFGKFYFYYSGTLTQAPVYDESNNIVAQPVVADVTGAFANIFLDSAITYRARLLDADDVEQNDYDPASMLSATSISTSGGGTVQEFINLLESSAGAGEIGTTSGGTVQSDLTTIAAESAINLAAAEAAALSAQLASAAAGAYPNGAATYLPKGLTQASVGAITAGSGGTNGTFALAWSSGNFTSNPVGTFTVAGNVLTAVTITQPGLYIGSAPVVPTPSFAASASLSGAAVALTAVSLIASGGGYWVQSPQNDALLHYLNVNGVATADGNTGPLALGDRDLPQAMLANEADGWGVDFSNSTEAVRGITKIAGAVANFAALSQIVDDTGTGWPTRIINSDGTRSWAPHNLFYNSETGSSPRTLTTISGEAYTILINGGTGSIALSGGGAGTANPGTPLTFTASGATVTFTKTGTATQVQVCIGSVVTAYVSNTTSDKLSQPPISYDPSLLCTVLLIEPGRTNYFLNSTVPVTQAISLVAGTYTVWCETASSGGVTVSGGPSGAAVAGTALAPGTPFTFTLVGTVSVTFTKTGSLNFVQVEQGSYPTSQIVTYGASRARTAGAPKALFAAMPTTVSAANTAGNPMTIYVDYAYTSTTGTLEEIVSLGTSGTNYLSLRMNTAIPYCYRRSAADTQTNPALLSQVVVTGTPPVTSVVVQDQTLPVNTREQITLNYQNNQLFASVNGLPLSIGNTVLSPIPTVGTTLWFGTFVGSSFLAGPVRIRRIGIVPSATKALAITSRFTQVTTNATRYKYFATYGQSNAAGNGALCDPTGLDAPGSHVFQYSQIGVVSSAVEPLNNPIPVTGSSSPYNGVALALARDILVPSGPLPYEPWVVLPGGIGNTGFGDTNAWGVGNAYHNNVLSMIGSFGLYYPNATLEMIYFAIGERDAVTYGMSQPTFENYMTAAIADIRTQAGNSTLPMVMGGPQPGYVAAHSAAFAPIIAAMVDIAATVTRTAYADPSASPAIPANGADLAHYSASQNRGVWSVRVGQAVAVA